MLQVSSPQCHTTGSLGAFHIPSVVLHSLLTGYSELLQVALPASHPFCLVARALVACTLVAPFQEGTQSPRTVRRKGNKSVPLHVP